MNFKKNYGELSYNPDNKSAFHRHVKSVVRSIIKELQACENITKFSIRSNQGGIAVSGEVYADLYINDDLSILLQVSSTCFGRERSDRVICFGQLRRAHPQHPKGGHTQIIDGNYNFEVDRESVISGLRQVLNSGAVAAAKKEIELRSAA